MKSITNVRRAALLGLAGLFSAAAVAGFIGNNGWATDVDAVELLSGPVVQTPAAPVQPAQDPQPEGIGDEPVVRKLDDDDSEVDSVDDADDQNGNTDDGESSDDGKNGANVKNSANGDSSDDGMNSANSDTGNGANVKNSANSNTGNSANSNTGNSANSNTGNRTTG